jgi:tRNA threonylcarbamoyl adenosine modification protein YeaZ
MISLIYNCSGLNLVAAIYQNQQLVISRQISESHKHSEIMVATIDDMLKQQNLHYYNLDLIATAKGPGSFTGLRVGLAFLKTLQTMLNIKVMAIDNFTLYAYQYYQNIKQQKLEDHNIFVALDSGNQNVYLCGFNIKKEGINKNFFIKILGYTDFAQYYAENQQNIFIGNAKYLTNNTMSEISINSLFEISWLRYNNLNSGFNFDDKVEIIYNIQ